MSRQQELQAFELEDLHFIKGEPIKLSDIKGSQVAVVEFWATYCPPCRDSIPVLSELQREFSDVVFVGISAEEEYTVRPFVQQMGKQMAYRVAVDSTRVTSASYMRAVNAQGIPTAFIISKQGKIVWHGHPLDPNLRDYIQRERAVQGKATTA
eukprot:TRINITY_DN11301_c0_g1_i2.p1 TRINITY_DN11301_c0_g1~~TRINITY_DN11301_c0_g1_i2.p1  ORF type:complete len:153 (+),score=32.02 TRINITY_DN11301_c0_g1_i2:70-528(+)